MEIHVPCPRCRVTEPASKLYAVRYQDNGRYVVACEHGHKDVQVLRQQKFEVLFEIGANAILDEYFREAVSSFTSSMERTFEFFLKAVFFEKQMSEQMNEIWKQMSKQSERQLGGFVSVYTLTLGTVPKVLSGKWVEFRNEVIHKGKVPTRDEAVHYGQAVLDVVRPIIKMAVENFPKGVGVTALQHDQACRLASDAPDLRAGFNAITILNLSVTGRDWHERTFEQALLELGQIRAIKFGK